MSAFAGIVALNGLAIDRRVGDGAVRALAGRHHARTSALYGDSAILAYRASLEPTNAPREGQPLSDPDRGVLFAALARLDNRDELGEALGLAGGELARTSDARLLQLMFERWGDAGVARCLGAFAFAHWDGAARALTLGRDCLGNRPLFYHCGSEFICFATTLGGLFALPGVPRAIDETALANFIAVNLTAGPQTFYSGIERVPSRTLVTIESAGIRRRHYWTPDLDAPPPYRRDEDYIERARELFDLAVATTTRDTPRVAIATSGGFDSSAIAATVARQGHARSIICFCMVPPSGTNVDVGPFHYLDERDKVEALARMHPNLELRLIACDHLHPHAHDHARLFVRTQLPSFGGALGVGLYLPDAVIADGHQVLQIGNYGNAGLTWQGRLSLVELLRDRNWKDFAQELRAVARESDRGWARTFAADVIMPTAPIGLRRLIHRMRGHDPDSVARYSALSPAFIAENRLAEQWRQARIDPWFRMRDCNPKRVRAYRLFDHNQYTRDIRALAEDNVGYESRDPHGDRRLLEFALSVPERIYRRDGIPRSFARRVFADRLPPAILNERRRGANTPNWFSSLDARRKEIAENIEGLSASPLASRLLDLPRLKRLMEQWPEDANQAQRRHGEYGLALARGVHVGRFIRWVEGGNA